MEGFNGGSDGIWLVVNALRVKQMYYGIENKFGKERGSGNIHEDVRGGGQKQQRDR